MKDIEMVYFDYGNTLIYEEVSYGPQTLEKIYQTLEEKPLSLEDFYQKFFAKVISYQEEYFSKDRDFLYRNIFAEIFREEKLKSKLTFEAMDKIYFDSHARGYPIEGAKELLAYLDKKNLPYGVISNLSLSADNLRQRIKEVLGVHVDLVFTSGESYYRKPDKNLFELAAKTADFPLEKILYIGDNPLCDYKGARDAGMKAIYFNSPRHSPFVLEEDKIPLEAEALRVDRLIDIIKILEGDIHVSR